MPSRTLAALTWHGRSPNESEVEARRAELAALLRAEGLEPMGPCNLWQYHPPFSPSWQRVNEVLMEVEGGPAAVERAAAQAAKTS